MRLAVTEDIDTTMLTTAEFYFKYGCHDVAANGFDVVDKSLTLGGKGKTLDAGQKDAGTWPRDHSVLLQYSTNGGISWTLLKEIHYPDTEGVRSDSHT